MQQFDPIVPKSTKWSLFFFILITQGFINLCVGSIVQMITHTVQYINDFAKVTVSITVVNSICSFLFIIPCGTYTYISGQNHAAKLHLNVRTSEVCLGFVISSIGKLYILNEHLSLHSHFQYEIIFLLITTHPYNLFIVMFVVQLKNVI